MKALIFTKGEVFIDFINESTTGHVLAIASGNYECADEELVRKVHSEITSNRIAYSLNGRPLTKDILTSIENKFAEYLL